MKDGESFFSHGKIGLRAQPIKGPPSHQTDEAGRICIFSITKRRKVIEPFANHHPTQLLLSMWRLKL